MATAVETGGGMAAERRPPRRHRRYFVVALGLLLVVGGLAALKGAEIATIIGAGKKMQAAGPPPETVSAARAETQVWNETLESVGSIASARGVNISNDAPGIVSKITFDSGATVREGQVLVELDTSVERAQLASARARRKLAESNAQRTRSLLASGAVAPAEGDTLESQLSAAKADEAALTAQIERKIVRAPFAGKLGIRLVNVGQYLAPGTPITALESEESNFVDFTLPQQDMSRIAVGMPVHLTLGNRAIAAGGDAGAAGADATVFAVEPAIDPTSRNIRVRASLPANAGLRPGMFVNVSVMLPAKENVVAVPATAIVHASYGDSVFVVEDEHTPAGAPTKSPDGSPSLVVRQQFVRLGRTRGDFVAVLDGVKAGEQVVTAGAFKLRNRARVALSDKVKLEPELTPHPANR
jgi:membrane fusion protein (multidrug efflux system)